MRSWQWGRTNPCSFITSSRSGRRCARRTPAEIPGGPQFVATKNICQLRYLVKTLNLIDQSSPPETAQRDSVGTSCPARSSEAPPCRVPEFGRARRQPASVGRSSTTRRPTSGRRTRYRFVRDWRGRYGLVGQKPEGGLVGASPGASRMAEISPLWKVVSVTRITAWHGTDTERTLSGCRRSSYAVLATILHA